MDINTTLLIIGSVIAFILAAILGIIISLLVVSVKNKRILRNMPDNMAERILKEKNKLKEVENANKEIRRQREQGNGETEGRERETDEDSGKTGDKEQLGRQRVQVSSDTVIRKHKPTVELHKPAAF